MKVLWTRFALDSLSEIYSYYMKNVNINMASIIRDNILSSTKQLENYPLLGQSEEWLIDLKEGHRYVVRGNHKIIYKIQNKKIYITDVFDTRQNPEKLIRRNK